jgi:uncharacterized protein (TIGR02246 family)
MSPNPDAAEAEVRALIENWANAVRNQDLAGAVARHAPDVLLFDVPPPLQSRGGKAYEASWKGFFDGWIADGGTFELNELSVTAGNDLAFSHALIECGNTRSSGRREGLVARLTVCLRKLDGEWTVVHEHHSTPAE